MDYKVVIYVNDAASHTDEVRQELYRALRDDGSFDFSIASVTPIDTGTGPDGKPLR